MSETSETAQPADRVMDNMARAVRAGIDAASNATKATAGEASHTVQPAADSATMDIYRDVFGTVLGSCTGAVFSAMILGRGWQQMQHAWLEMIDHTMENAAHKPQDVLRCRNAVELAEVQRDPYLGVVNHAFEFTGRLLGMAGRTSQEGMRPLQLHH